MLTELIVIKLIALLVHTCNWVLWWIDMIISVFSYYLSLQSSLSHVLAQIHGPNRNQTSYRESSKHNNKDMIDKNLNFKVMANRE